MITRTHKNKSISYYANDGKELAVWYPSYVDTQEHSETKFNGILSLNSDRLDWENQNLRMSDPIIDRALPQYKTDIKEILELYPNAKITEHLIL